VSITKQDRESLEKFETIQHWFNSGKKVRSPHTKKHHLEAVVRLLRNNPQFDNNPDKWITWAKPPQDDGTERFRDSTQIQKTIELATTAQNDNEAKRTKASLRSFLHKHGINNLSSDDLTTESKIIHNPYEKDQIDEILNKLRLDTHKLFVTIAHTSGLRTDAILSLRWKHIQREYQTEEYIHLDIEPEKIHREKAVSPYAFIGPDSKALIEKLSNPQQILRTTIDHNNHVVRDKATHQPVRQMITIPPIINNTPDSPIIALAYNSIH